MTDHLPVFYRVTVSHVAKPWAGVHTVVVKSNNGNASFYAVAKHFGCGRDYPSRELAIIALVRESAGLVESIEGLPVPSFA